MTMCKGPVIAAALLMAAAIFPRASIAAEDQSQLMLGAGIYGFGVASEPNNAEFRVQYRFKNGFLASDGSFRGFKPLVGLAGHTSGSAFGYAGFALPFVLGADDRWEIVAEGALGAYRQGASSLNLGGTFEFHLGLAANYAVSDNRRLGLGIYHISNANLHAKNPGVNSILATYTFAFAGR